ncbi:MAG: LuxR C-terminal-related transcriptional regulator [Pseudomonadota bacterium]|nr:LuxR C-terminal-related transcriptional regulator [Pseudomonadota bacterium]
MVLRWVAAGKTDRDVGSILGCSHRTVQKHLQRISSTKSLASRPGRRRPCAAVPPAVPKRPDSSRTLPRDNRRACSTR